MLSEVFPAFAGILQQKLLTMSLIHENYRSGNYKSPEIMIIDVATECGFAASDPKYDKYGVGIDPYEYDDEL